MAKKTFAGLASITINGTSSNVFKNRFLLQKQVPITEDQFIFDKTEMLKKL